MENSINNANHFYFFFRRRRISYNAFNAEIIMGIETDDIINQLFESIIEKYQEGL